MSINTQCLIWWLAVNNYMINNTVIMVYSVILVKNYRNRSIIFILSNLICVENNLYICLIIKERNIIIYFFHTNPCNTYVLR